MVADNLNGKRRRRLGICHHSLALLPAPLRLLQDLAKPVTSPALHRRNAFRKNSAPAKPGIEIAGQAGQKLPVAVTNLQKHRCSLTAVSQGLSIISTPAVVVLYVSDGRTSRRRRRNDSEDQKEQPETAVRSRRVTYPVAPRGVRHCQRWRQRRWSLAPATSWIQPSGVKTEYRCAHGHWTSPFHGTF